MTTHIIEAPAYRATRRKVQKAFVDLRRKGYFARMNWKCCMGCGFAAIPEQTQKAVFYHAQDAETLRRSGRLFIAWDGSAAEVRQSLESAGLVVTHDGSEHTRFLVTLPE